MELRREVLVSVGTLLVLSVLLAFGAIGLFGRMGPAIARILQENAPSIQAGQELLVVIGHAAGKPASPALRERFASAIERASAHVTLPEEEPLIAELQKHAAAALNGEGLARSIVVSRASRLVSLNVDAMHKADAHAQRLGAAGAWISVFVATLLCGLGLLVLRRLHARVVAPLEDLGNVVRAATHGERFRRCRPFAGPRELSQTLDSVNALLDERLVREGRTSMLPGAGP